MGLEALGSIGRVASVAPSIGRIASMGMPHLEGGFSIGKISNPFIGGVSKAASSYVENRVPSLIGPKVEAIKNPFKADMAPSVIARSVVTKQSGQEIAALPSVARNDVWKQSYVRIPEPARVVLPNPDHGLDVRVLRNPFQAPKVEVHPQVRVQQITESTPASRVVKTTSTPIQKEALVRAVTENKPVVKEEKKKEESQKTTKKRAFIFKQKYVHHKGVTERRILDIKEAILKAEKDGLITGSKVAEYLYEHKGVRGEIVGENGPDGTFILTRNGIKNDLTIVSKDAALQRYIPIVYEHRPTKVSQEGEPITAREVDEAFMERNVVKPNAALEIVAKRQDQKNTQIITNGQVVSNTVEDREEVPEANIERFPAFAEVFQKAA